MSKTEKRYFKMEAKRSGGKDNNYIKLYDVLNDMEEYDESKLRKKFKNSRILKHFPQEKKYLYDAILRSLRNYRSDRSTYAQLKERILDARYLLERGLYEQGERMLRRARKLAEKLNDQLSMLEILREERRLITDIRGKERGKALEGLISERYNIFDNLQLEQEFLDIQHRLFVSMTLMDGLRNEEEIKALEENLGLSKLEINEEGLPSLAQRAYYQSKAHFYQLARQFEKASDFQTKVLNWWDSNPVIKEEEFNRYIATISNVIQILFKGNQYQYIPALLQKLESEEATKYHDAVLLFRLLVSNQLLYYMNMGQFDKAQSLVPKIDAGLKKYQLNARGQLVLYGNIAILLFVMNDYKDCKDWANRILKCPKTDTRQDIQRFARILIILASYESNADDTDALVRASQNYFSKLPGISEVDFEPVVLKYLKKIIFAPLLEKKALIKEFDQYLQKLAEEPEKRRMLGLDELQLWTQSKLQRLPMIDLIRKKSQNRKA
ncbi:MAG: hypothetical protein AAFP19_04605 [Bacteroidota bacterium]